MAEATSIAKQIIGNTGGQVPWAQSCQKRMSAKRIADKARKAAAKQAHQAAHRAAKATRAANAAQIA